MFDMFEVLLEQILDILFFDDPWGDRFFDLLFFLDENLWGINLMFFKFAGLYSFADFRFGLLFFF